MRELGARINLVVCQKSKIDDWIDHFKEHYSQILSGLYNLTDKKALSEFIAEAKVYHYNGPVVGVINYDLIFRRPEIKELEDFTLMLDESSLIQNPTAARTKFIMKMQPKNVILLSGTPTGGKYERLITQMNLLGWKISDKVFWNQYVNWEWNETEDGFWQKKVLGYKNEERLKRRFSFRDQL